MLLERGVQKLEQPRPHDGSVAPDAGDLLELELVLRVIHDLEALGVGLHEPVLDAVVHHLHEVPGARSAHVCIPVLRRERLEDRLESLHRLSIAADHQTEAHFESPDPTGDTRIDEVNPVVSRLLVASLRVAEVRVAAVDDRVAFVGDSE